MTRYDRLDNLARFVEATLADAGPHERFTPDAVDEWAGKPLKDMAGNVIGEMTEAWVEDDGRTIKGRFFLTSSVSERVSNDPDEAPDRAQEG